ncbi:glutamate-5-semialdehyde dehydrogenase [Microbacterium karelineae]|uniref:glutamate-5-semialdehyde dehydrogenase n=1 Tax=Microbacterium karelineae TaxID=2654283 RepID=UPI0012EA8F2D|nr:glutamate-5-semialdehyde dehydrogenase [Microbacterium karelineae]
MTPTDAPEARFALAKQAARGVARLTSTQKSDALHAIADALLASEAKIVAANAEDLARGREKQIGDSLLDRLALSPERIVALADATRQVAALPDPVGQVVRGERMANGIRLEQLRVPFGVVGAIYEARPNVTVDIAALALRSGNAVVLRGGSAAMSSNMALVSVMRDALASQGIDPESIQTVDEFGRDGANALMTGRGFIDVLVPRGSAGLIETVVTQSTVPVIETGAGNVHVVLDASAPDDWARDITVNSKTHRVSVCNSAESVLVLREGAERLVPLVVGALQAAGVTVHGDETVQALAGDIVPATEEDWGTEYLSLDVSMKVVDTLDEAIDHIDRYSTHHTETIVTADVRNAERFLTEVDSAAVYVNASTRFTDGGEYGFGAEVGISTQKLHARGPMGLPELTSTKWVGRGSGQIRP